MNVSKDYVEVQSGLRPLPGMTQDVHPSVLPGHVRSPGRMYLCADPISVLTVVRRTAPRQRSPLRTSDHQVPANTHFLTVFDQQCAQTWVLAVWICERSMWSGWPQGQLACPDSSL